MSLPRFVFIPIAAIAAIKKNRESSLAVSSTIAGRLKVLLISIKITKPIKNPGTFGNSPWLPLFERLTAALFLCLNFVMI